MSEQARPTYDGIPLAEQPLAVERSTDGGVTWGPHVVITGDRFPDTVARVQSCYPGGKGDLIRDPQGYVIRYDGGLMYRWRCLPPVRDTEQGPVTVLGCDDWLVYARTARGWLVYTVVEVWPEWLNAPHRGRGEFGTPQWAADWRHMMGVVVRQAADLDWRPAEYGLDCTDEEFTARTVGRIGDWRKSQPQDVADVAGPCGCGEHGCQVCTYI